MLIDSDNDCWLMVMIVGDDCWLTVIMIDSDNNDSNKLIMDNDVINLVNPKYF